MTDPWLESEVAWKNGFHAGVEAGYVRGVLDNAADVMEGRIRWHFGEKPADDLPVCYICQKAGEGRYRVRPAAYRKKHNVFFVDEIADDGSYSQVRVSYSETEAWADMVDPFSAQWTIEVPKL